MKHTIIILIAAVVIATAIKLDTRPEKKAWYFGPNIYLGSEKTHFPWFGPQQ
jgi:hypothetical protein